MIPEDVISEIKRRADIAAVIGRTVKLKKAGKNLVGLCPFHNEKTPSFNVHPDEGFFYCFGCKAAGDVVSFLERTTGRGFLDIVSELAEQTGVELPKNEVSPEEAARQAEKKRALRALELAQVFFRTRLAADEGKPARAYLGEVRKIDEAAIDKFGLGFAGARDDGLVTFLQAQGVSVDDAVLAGVASKNERGSYDFFRHRVTIPIRDLRGRVVSFQGRIFGEREVAPDGTKRPKYVNGPQSPVYDKSAVLFGLHEALPALKKAGSGWDGAAVLVEGPLDAIAVYRAGVPAAVAPCGTGLTPRHVDEIAAKTERIVVCLDADKAGKEAAARAILMFLQRGFDVGLVALPDKDPDSLVQAGRADELRGLVLGAPSALDAMIARAREKSTGNMRARVQALDTLLPFLAAPSRDLVRSEAVRAVARAFNEEPSVIQNEVEKRGRRMLSERMRGTSSSSSRQDPRGRPGPASSGSGAPDRGARSAAAPAAVARAAVAKPAPRAKQRPFSEAEAMLVDAVLTHPHLAARCGVLAPSLRHPELRGFIERLIEMLVRFHDEDPRDVLKKRVGVRPDGAIRAGLLRLEQSGAFDRPDAYMPEATAARIVEDAILMLDKRVLEVRLGELQRLLAEADERGDHGERKRVLAEQAALVDALKALASPAARPLAAPVAKAVAALPAQTAPIVVAPPEVMPAEPERALVEDAPVIEEAPPPVGAGADDAPWAGDPDDDPWAV